MDLRAGPVYHVIEFEDGVHERDSHHNYRDDSTKFSLDIRFSLNLESRHLLAENIQLLKDVLLLTMLLFLLLLHNFFSLYKTQIIF